MRQVEINTNAASMRELYESFMAEYRNREFYDCLTGLCQRDDVQDVVEFGVFQGGSTAAFLTCPIRSLRSYDIDISKVDKSLFRRLNKTVLWDLQQRSSTDPDPFDSCDLLLLDTQHTYDHVMRELTLHGHRSRRYIAVHDTKYPPPHKNPKLLVGDAVRDYAARNGWELVRKGRTGSGFMVIKK
jgi:hypothetical protein